jgi:cytochrome c oxidase subunit II
VPAFDADRRTEVAMIRRLGPAAACLLLTSCSGWQSALDPHSSEASHLANLFWLFAGMNAVIWLLVAAALIYTVRRAGGDDVAGEDNPDAQRRKTVVVSTLVGLTVAILAIFTLMSFYATRAITWHNTQTLTVKITGRQWWWDIEYQNDDPHQIFHTANEIHIPVGRPVTLQLEAADVIHSFWVPNLMGKQDLIPGRKNYLTIRADKPGLYRGQCAEFCGLEHAHMAILVFAEDQARFDSWRRRQLSLAARPGAPQRVAGMQIFMSGPCAACHTILGTDAGGVLGPDLTHFGGRATIAAGLLPNTPRALEAWLADPQARKPGVMMPKVSLSPNERTDLVAYLEGLK